MKRLLILVIVLLLAVMVFSYADWLSFDSDSKSASVTLNTEEVKEDTKAAFEKGSAAVDKAVDEIENAPEVDVDVEVKEEPAVEE
ncbi:hypothetical protein Pla110_17540 [Polystyrenella longa]|uniref:Uncharacterized protein n=1 Tax=Polystyrenella longa TaxID=2528007 RepID=A0A518CLC8_9PLAN|nr:hypothetical protein [Polystyrenella longa]QDU80032.1 hypothetical protein Pla110_17540 [Polystyrenella longa]